MFAKMDEKLSAVNKGTDGLIKLVGKVLGGMEKFVFKLNPMIDVPLVGDTIKEVQDIVYMLNDYYRGNYKKVPVTAIIGSVAIIGYLASPIDLIPDSVPILGFVDDAFIINIIIELCLDKELEEYRKWRKTRPAELTEEKA